jgi:hypothetical protein
MDQKLSELTAEVEELKKVVLQNSIMINKIILMMNVAETDLKNHMDLLDA